MAQIVAEEEKNMLEEDALDMFYEEEDKKNRNRKINAAIICVLVLLILLICFKIGNIGFNAVTSWEVDNIELTEENLQILNNTKLNVFSKLKNGKIAPMSSGTYRFSVKNKSIYDMIYNIKFEESMSSYINMKYRLKIDNIYVRGNSNEYVSLSELDLENIIVPKNSINIYTLEWCWENDDENDTKAAILEEDQYYYFKLQISSNIYNR